MDIGIMSHIGRRPKLRAEDQRRMAETLGIDDPIGNEPLTVSEMRESVERDSDSEFGSMGETIRNDLVGRLDAELLEEELANIGTNIGRLPVVRAEGVPDEPEGPYGEIVAPVERVYDHLTEVGFFESVEGNLPRFTPEYIERTARELVLTDPLTSALTNVGFDEREKTALLMNVVNNNTRLARWVPTYEIPDGVEFDLEHVPPLHDRAYGGALLWIAALDRHLWQNEVLITEAILDDATWYTKALLGGLYVSTMAARDVAAGGGLEDAQLTAALTAGAAIQIIAQEDMMRDVYYITDDMRAPSEVR